MEKKEQGNNTEKKSGTKKPKGEVKFQLSLNEEQKEAKQLIIDNTITVIHGMAGSGKTLVAAQCALDMLFKREVERIVIARPMVARTDMGALPGSAEDKLYPWLIPIYANLYMLYDKVSVDKLIEEGIIEVLPFQFVRGRTLTDAFVIVDECVTGDTRISTGLTGRKIGSIEIQKPISKIIADYKKGIKTEVLSYNHKSDSIESKEVIGIFESGEKPIKEIYTYGRKIPIKITDNHPVAIFEGEEIVYKKVSDLQINDLMVRPVKKDLSNSINIPELKDHEFQKVKPSIIKNISCSRITDIKEGGIKPVYNIEVADNNNYLANNLLVHNCQNITNDEMEMIIGRLGKGSKMVFCGDSSQVDLKNKKDSGLTFLKVIEDRIDGLRSIILLQNHRHPIVKQILEIYNEYRKD